MNILFSSHDFGHLIGHVFGLIHGFCITTFNVETGIKFLFRLAQSPHGCYFASAGADGLVKLWSLNRIQGDLSMTVRADATFTYGGMFSLVLRNSSLYDYSF